MIRINKSFLPVLSVLLLSGGCKKYLDVKPEDKYLDDQVFSNASTVQQALNGIYNDLSASSLYGASLTMQAADILAQDYNIDGNNLYFPILNTYQTQGAIGSTFDALWSSAYSVVLKTNTFIGQLQKTRGNGVLTEPQASELLGEATAIRAMIQFDLLRLYGPQYTGGNADAPAIPYYKRADGIVQPILHFGEVMDTVLADLGTAAQLLSNDPVITTGVITTGNVDFYRSLRNRRLNYYAVKALQARAFLYEGKNDSAHAAAKIVVGASDRVFPWTNYSDIIGNTNPDRIFSSEVLMGLYNPNLYSLQTLYFSNLLQQTAMLAPAGYQLDNVFEYNQNDYRYTTTWLNSNYGFRTFYKFADVPDITKAWRFFQPLIRKTEMYYILAETDPDPGQALQYLNTVRFNRGLPDLPDGSDMPTEIGKEYSKEFYGEGQLFFYYKRTNSNWSINYYQVPLPLSETQLR